MAQKNRLKYILLGLLNTKNQTGYDLTKSFDSDIGEFWNANHSQIYPLLKRMEAAQLISHRLITVGQKLQKKEYAITAKGREQFMDWLATPAEMDGAHDEFLLKLFFVDDPHSELLPPMIRTQLGYHEAKLAHLKKQFAQKFPNQNQILTSYGHALVLRHAIERETGYRDWLQTIMRDLARFEDE
ncbi:PadR family transcriptional regulator [Pediococcus siamensis]|uniref:PadR family transcriptional regulator n=1 Tax=Pediococcus siamensis TaxID=381829 RepID=UPI0039A0B66B